MNVLLIGGPMSGQFYTLRDGETRFDALEMPSRHKFYRNLGVVGGPPEDTFPKIVTYELVTTTQLLSVDIVLIPNVMVPQEWWREKTLAELRELVGKEIVGWAQDAEAYRGRRGAYR